jgi:hypothetical protein
MPGKGIPFFAELISLGVSNSSARKLSAQAAGKSYSNSRKIFFRMSASILF